MAKRRGWDAVRGGTSGGVGGERNYGAGALASRGRGLSVGRRGFRLWGGPYYLKGAQRGVGVTWTSRRGQALGRSKWDTWGSASGPRVSGEQKLKAPGEKHLED